MRLTIHGRRLPGRQFCSDGELLRNVHVAVQVGKDAEHPVPGDARSATWHVDVRPVVDADGELDVRGPAIHGKRGERFLYLTWGDIDPTGSFAMFRRAKLMIGDIDHDLLTCAAQAGETLRADVDLTDERGDPRCARVRPPAVRWSIAD